MATKRSSEGGPPGRPLLGWAVHLLTASGAVIALLAMQAIGEERWRDALLWLLLALLIDGVDGTLARAARVETRVPRVNGEALDLIVDYLNYVFVPTLLMWRAGLLPGDLALAFAALIQLSSLYVFTRRDLKTADGCFLGFPALWNVVAFYLFLIRPPEWASGAIVLALVALTFAPMRFVHPFRSLRYRGLALATAAVWAASTGALLLVQPGAPAMPLLLACSLAAAFALTSIGAITKRVGK